MKLKRTVSLTLAFILILSCLFSGATVSAAQGTEVLSSNLVSADVELLATFNSWEGLTMNSIDGTTVGATVVLEAGNYQFKLRQGETEYGHPGTIKDTTVTVSESGWTLSSRINAKCTLIATGGTYTFIFNTETCKLQIIKDGFIPEVSDSDELTVNFADTSVTAKTGDILTYSVYLTADKAFEDIQAILSYNEEKLSLVKITSSDSTVTDNEAEAKVYCPNIADVIYNSEYAGIVAANASSVSGFDFTEEKLFFTFDFEVLSGGETTLEFILQEMTANDGNSYFAYSTEVNEGVTVRETVEVESSTELPAEKLAFSGASLTLQDNLCINFKANESLFTEVGYENPYVIFELNGEEFTVSDYEVVGGKYVFDFADIAPNNMNDTVKATLYATFDGVEYVSEIREYSVATYCYNMLGRYTTSAYAELQTLLVDLLNYGAMSQIYTGHNTDNLVNANLTDAQKAWGTSEKPVYESVQDLAYKTIDNPTVQWKGGGLNLVDAVTMRFKISADSYENLVVQAETDDRIWTIPYEEFSETTDGYYVYFSGLNAGEMSEPVYLTVYEGDTAVSNTLSYSIESYAYSKQNSTDTNLVNLLEAMMKYGNSAYAYVH